MTMLFKIAHLKRIEAGEITLAFRRWKKASVKKGSLIHTAVGLIEICNMEEIEQDEITGRDAVRAGFSDREELLKSLPVKSTATLFKITLRYHSPDPRIKLREQTELSKQEFEELRHKVERLDKFSRRGPWTGKVLRAIAENPHMHAVGISSLTGFEKEWLKRNIRKLKNLGLTISHQSGYELSPLGKYFMERIGADD